MKEKFDFKFNQNYEIFNEDFKVMLFEIEEREEINEQFDKVNQKKEMENKAFRQNYRDEEKNS